MGYRVCFGIMEFSLNCDIIWSPVPFKRKQEGFGGNIAHDFPERPNVVRMLPCVPHYHSQMTMTKTNTNTHTETNTKTKAKTKCSKDPPHAIFLKSWEFKDIRYDAYNEKNNDQEKDKDNDNDKDKEKDKDKDESAENLNICYIFEKLRIQGFQI